MARKDLYGVVGCWMLNSNQDIALLIVRLHCVAKERNTFGKYYSEQRPEELKEAKFGKPCKPIYDKIGPKSIPQVISSLRKKKRVKTSHFTRDKDKMAEMKEAVKLARNITKQLQLKWQKLMYG
jgi:hypothetical protein